VVQKGVGIAVAGIAVKILVKKEGKFEGTCASMNPETNPNGDPCQFCGRTPSEYHGNCSREIYQKILEEKQAKAKADLKPFDWQALNRNLQ
jgi:hypothetical protein